VRNTPIPNASHGKAEKLIAVIFHPAFRVGQEDLPEKLLANLEAGSIQEQRKNV
jgi:hypothetical protein